MEVKNKLREKTLKEPTRPAKQVYDSVTGDENRHLTDVGFDRDEVNAAMVTFDSYLY